MTGDPGPRRSATHPATVVRHPSGPAVRRLLVVFVLVAAVVAVYLPVSSFPFLNWDDQGYVTKNPRVLRGLSGEGIAWAFTTATVGNWEPLVWLSHMLAVDLFGLHPGAHHLVNVVLHAATAAFLFLALEGMTGAVAPTAIAALLFAVHPQGVEAVAWVSARKDVLAGFCFALLLLSYLWYVRRPNRLRALAVAVAFGLALASKPIAVAFPIVLLCLDFWPLGRVGGAGGAGRRAVTAVVAEKSPLLLAALGYGAWTVVNQWRTEAINLDRAPGLALANAAVATVVGLGRMVWPSGYSPLYRYPDAIPAWQWTAGALLLAAFCILAFRLRFRRPWLVVGWFWFLAVLLPVSGVIPVGYQAWADRYAYLPAIGLFTALCWEGKRLSARHSRRGIIIAAAGLVPLLLAAVSRHDLAFWGDSVSLFRRAQAVDPGNARARLALGNVFGGSGRHAEALAEFEAAARLDPLAEGLAGNLGYEYSRAGRFQEALPWLIVAASAAPDDTGARRDVEVALVRAGWTRDRAVEVLRLLGIGRQGDLPVRYSGSAPAGRTSRVDAESVLRLTAAVCPECAPGWDALGLVLGRRGLAMEAAAVLREAVRLAPGNELFQRDSDEALARSRH